MAHVTFKIIDAMFPTLSLGIFLLLTLLATPSWAQFNPYSADIYPQIQFADFTFMNGQPYSCHEYEDTEFRLNQRKENCKAEMVVGQGVTTTCQVEVGMACPTEGGYLLCQRTKEESVKPKGNAHEPYRIVFYVQQNDYLPPAFKKEQCTPMQ